MSVWYKPHQAKITFGRHNVDEPNVYLICKIRTKDFKVTSSNFGINWTVEMDGKTVEGERMECWKDIASRMAEATRPKK